MTKLDLYYHPYSICSLQVLYTLAIAAAYTDAGKGVPEIEQHFVDIFKDDQLEETFLTRINPKGQVPVLTSTELPSPIADSLLITKYLMDRWPCLSPPEHAAMIENLLDEIHTLNYFALSFPDRPQIADKLVSTVEERLARSNLSLKYGEALAYKLSVTIEEKFNGIKPENTEINEGKAKRLFAKLESLLHESPWLLGLKQPTALDAHAVILIARLSDVGRTAIVPKRLQMYAGAAFETPVLQSVMQGRRTMISKA
ncbi:uncharacterized protein AB675_4437 [Cyphellophora attinorum]|uniref:GST N-terminal domain-containing protein n=1 Tax=Cyphellophora attinorum TaxID=1664694 RepID=A0A0N1NY75_9EURO|nr:uncharacterized protein AB675_4437 [Phialophora attinorum]KPI36525.1 hypothetical protein AB675_4437 [Phialophora attinorum]